MTVPRAAAAVVVNYRSYDELGRCLASLETSRAVLTEAVVIDHDADLARSRAVAERFPWTRVLPTIANEGFAAGINRGARETRAPFLLLLNPDTVLAPRACETLLDFLLCHSDVGVAGPKVLNEDGTLQGSARKFPGLTAGFAGRGSWLTRVWQDNPFSRSNIPAFDMRREGTQKVDWVSGACMLVRREAFDRVGGMDEGFFLYWEDADFCRRLDHAGWATMYVPHAVASHIGAASSRQAEDASLVAFHRSAFRLFRKHARPVGRLLVPVVYTALQTRLAILRLAGRWRASGMEF